MAFATVTDLIERYGAGELVELTDRSEDALVSAEMLSTSAAGGSMSGYTADEQAATAACMTTIARALADVESEIGPYLAARYTLPLAVVPRVLVAHACAMTRYALHGDRVTDVVEAHRKNALDFLRAVSAGRASLGLDTAGSEVAAPEAGGVLRTDTSASHPDLLASF